MLDYGLVSATDDEFVYEYHCEGDPSRAGKVGINPDTCEARFIGETPNIYRWYAGHLASTLEKLARMDALNESGTDMWY